MSAQSDAADGWAERAQLHYLADEDLEPLVVRVREILRVLEASHCVAEAVPLLVAAISRDPQGIEGESIEAAARALVFLACHGIPHGRPTTH